MKFKRESKINPIDPHGENSRLVVVKKNVEYWEPSDYERRRSLSRGEDHCREAFRRGPDAQLRPHCLPALQRLLRVADLACGASPCQACTESLFASLLINVGKC